MKGPWNLPSKEINIFESFILCNIYGFTFIRKCKWYDTKNCMCPLETMSNICSICYQHVRLTWIKPICSRTFKKRAIYIRNLQNQVYNLFHVEEPCRKDIRCDLRGEILGTIPRLIDIKYRKPYGMHTMCVLFSLKNISFDFLVKL